MAEKPYSEREIDEYVTKIHHAAIDLAALARELAPRGRERVRAHFDRKISQALTDLSQVEHALSQLILEGIQTEADKTMLHRIGSAREKIREIMRKMGFKGQF